MNRMFDISLHCVGMYMCVCVSMYACMCYVLVCMYMHLLVCVCVCVYVLPLVRLIFSPSNVCSAS